MIKSAVTVSLVEQARGGPFVYWNGLDDAFAKAKQFGYDAVEIFAPNCDAVDRAQLHRLVKENGIDVAAVGTGAGMVISGLSLTAPDEKKRGQAREFVRQMIQFGAEFNAPAIIGSMQGRHGKHAGGVLDKPTALGYLRDAFTELGEFAKTQNVPLVYEPLNRYETNLVNTIVSAVKLVESAETDNVKILADLFHMNIEESNVADALRAGAGHIGHIHFVDSNRWAAGFGHTDFDAVVTAINEIGFDGYLAIEAFALPDSDRAAEKSIETFNKYFPAAK